MTLQEIKNEIMSNATTVTSGKKGMKAYIDVDEVAKAIYEKLSQNQSQSQP